MEGLTLIILSFCVLENTFCQRKVSAEIPVDEKGNFVFLFNVVKKYNKLLDLPSLETGYDSLELRIWCNYGNLKKTHLIIVSNQAGKWDGTLFRLLIDKKNDTSYFLEKKKKLKLIPKSGWGEMIKAMNELRIPELKSYENLPYGIGVDGQYYMVEIATKNNYRFYDYFDPQEAPKNYSEAIAFEKFLITLEKEFLFLRREVF